MFLGLQNAIKEYLEHGRYIGKHNKQYIRSTYNDFGILGLWTEYVKTLDGGDVGIRSHLKQHPDAHFGFQFTIFKVLPKSISINEAT